MALENRQKDGVESVLGDYDFARVDPSDFYNAFGLYDNKYCRYLFTPDSESKWNPIGNPTDKRRTADFDQVLPSAQYKNVYFTPNEFFKWHTARQTARLHAFYVDIDTKNHGIVSETTENAIANSILSYIDSQKLPVPTYIVRSGSGGLHLYYLFETPVEAFPSILRSWQLAARSLIDKLSHKSDLYSVDSTPSLNPAVKIRLPGSTHGKSHRKVTAYSSRKRYDFFEFCSKLDVTAKPYQPTSKTETQSKSRTISTTTRTAPRHNNYNEISVNNLKNYWTWLAFNTIKHVNKQGSIQKGNRSKLLFFIYNALRMFLDHDIAYERVNELRERLCPDFTLTDLDSAISSAVKTRYYYQKITALLFLSSCDLDLNQFGSIKLPAATPKDKVEALQKAGLSTDNLKLSVSLDKNEIHKRQKLSAVKTASKRKQKTLTRIIQTIKNLTQRSIKVTQAQIAELCNLSISTIKRYWNTQEIKTAIPLRGGGI